ncbi:MAG: permease prefix domain 1-containing protein [Candidatus Limnocylindria bacterium]
MTQLTERYLAAALRGIPEDQRADVERELRSSIGDALEDRLSAGEDRAEAEKAVLEGLGDPQRLAAGITGRPLHLIGPELFVGYRQLLVMLLAVSLPIVGVVQAAIAVNRGDELVGALVVGAGAAWTVGLHIFFWVTITFAVIERVDAMREAREQITSAIGAWTVDRLPALPAGRISVGELVGEVLTTALTIGAILFLETPAWFTDASGEVIPLFNPNLWSGWLPLLIAVLATIAGLHVIIFLAGRWTTTFAITHALLEAAFAVPVVALALTGSLINPDFADALGWPPLADGRGLPMIVLAAAVLLVTGWEIIDGFRRARRANAGGAGIGEPGQAAS